MRTIDNVQQPYDHTHDETLINRIVDVFYDKMLDDYRVNRFFNGNSVTPQTDSLKTLLITALASKKDAGWQDLLDEYFMAAFARSNAKRSLVTGNDFAFLLDIVGGKEIKTITLLSDGHSHLLKLGPDDSHYDVVMEHLTATLKELNVVNDFSHHLLAMAERARDPVLGRQTA